MGETVEGTARSGTNASAQRKQNAQALAAGYSVGKQRFETFCIFSFAIIFTYNMYKLFVFTTEQRSSATLMGTAAALLIAIFMCVIALCTADFISGFVHWMFDTWGTVQIPIFGNTFIRSFREHHVNPSALAHHDWREANGDNCFTTLPLLTVLAFTDISAVGSSFWPLRAHYALYIYLVILTFFVMLTNQFHKWAHMRPDEVPSVVRSLQSRHIILSKPVHNIHHTSFDAYYCITTGWMNAPLESISFWRRLEAVITAVTGAQPREDDAKWAVGRGTVESKDAD